MNVHAVLDGISVVGICQVRSVQGGIYEMERRDSEQHGLCYFYSSQEELKGAGGKAHNGQHPLQVYAYRAVYQEAAGLSHGQDEPEPPEVESQVTAVDYHPCMGFGKNSRSPHASRYMSSVRSRCLRLQKVANSMMKRTVGKCHLRLRRTVHTVEQLWYERPAGPVSESDNEA